MKKISLRLRFTLTASVFLFVSCTVLAFLSNFSANKMVEAIELQPSVAVQEGDVLFFSIGRNSAGHCNRSTKVVSCISYRKHCCDALYCDSGKSGDLFCIRIRAQTNSYPFAGSGKTQRNQSGKTNSYPTKCG